MQNLFSLNIFKAFTNTSKLTRFAQVTFTALLATIGVELLSVRPAYSSSKVLNCGSTVRLISAVHNRELGKYFSLQPNSAYSNKVVLRASNASNNLELWRVDCSGGENVRLISVAIQRERNMNFVLQPDSLQSRGVVLRPQGQAPEKEEWLARDAQSDKVYLISAFHNRKKKMYFVLQPNSLKSSSVLLRPMGQVPKYEQWLVK